MKIKLLTDWDFFPRYDQPVGHFTGRKLLKERLFNEIIRRTSGAILVSGSRGVGKTALVYESLRKVAEELQKRNLEVDYRKIKRITITKVIKEIKIRSKKIKLPLPKFTLEYPSRIALLPIVINVSQIDLNYITASDSKVNTQLLRKEVIVMLIRGLFAAVKKNDPDKLELLTKLRDTALATEYRISKESDNSNLSEYGFNGEIKINFDGILSSLVGFSISLLFIPLIYFVLGFIPDFNNVLRSILSLLPSIGVLAISFFTKTKNSKSKSEKELYIRDDNSITNLEIMLENVLEQLSNYFRPVYIIDELDALEKSGLNPDPPMSIIQLVKTYKNLFNLVDAIFIFLAGHKTWNLLQESDRKDIHHTLFTSSIFLPKPAFGDIRDYIKIIAPEVRDWNKVEPKTIINYLIYSSKAEYFDLKNVISNNISSYLLDDRPVLEIDFDRIKTRQSKIEEVLETLFDYHKLNDFNQNEENYNFLELLYKVFDYITPVELFEIYQIAEDNRWELYVEGIRVYDTGHKWFKNLINFLEWLSFIENVDQEDFLADNPTPPPAKTLSHTRIRYRWTGSYRNVPKKISNLETEEMRDFKNEFIDFSKDILLVENIYDYLDKGTRSVKKIPVRVISTEVLQRFTDITSISVKPLYDEQYTIYRSLLREMPKYISATELTNNQTKISDLREQIFINKTDLISRLVWNVAKKKRVGMEYYTSRDNLNYLNSYPELQGLLQNESAFILYSSQSKRIIVVCSLPVSSLENLNTSVIKRANSLRIININGDYTNKNSKKSFNQIVINIPSEKINENLVDMNEGKSTLKKISQFIRWI